MPLSRSAQCKQGLVRLADKYPIIDVRGRGLMCAVEFGGHNGSMTASPGVAAALTKAAGKRNMLLLTAGKSLSTPAAPHGWQSLSLLLLFLGCMYTLPLGGGPSTIDFVLCFCGMQLSSSLHQGNMKNEDGLQVTGIATTDQQHVCSAELALQLTPSPKSLGLLSVILVRDLSGW